MAVHPFNPLPLLRLAIVADCDPEAVRRIFRFVWRDGRIGDLPIEWAELMADLDLADAATRIGEPEVKEALRRNTDDAIARGVFGVPTLAIGDELFWGADATAMAVRRICDIDESSLELLGPRRLFPRRRPAASYSIGADEIPRIERLGAGLTEGRAGRPVLPSE